MSAERKQVQRARQRAGRGRSAGFTLIELMMTLLIASVLIAVAAPGLVDLLERNRLQTLSNQVMTSLMLTRSEALKRNQPAVMCKSANGTSCAAGGNWEQGWIVYADEDADGVKDAGEPVLSVNEALDSGDTLRTSVAAIASRIIYRTDGTTTASGTFILCNSDQDTSLAREITVEVTGRPQRSKGTADCTP